MAKRKSVVPKNLLDRVPPNDPEAERAVIGSILLDPTVIDDVLLRINETAFYDPAHRSIFETMRAMTENGERIDPTLLYDRLQTRGELEAIGGAKTLAEAANCVPHAAHAVYYADIVRDKYTLRALVNAGTQTVADAFAETGQRADEILEACESRIFGIAEQSLSLEVSVRPLTAIVNEAVERLNSRTQGELCGVPTGFSRLDEKLGGLKPRELIVLGGRPGHGKTSMGLALAMQAAEHERRVMVVSLEMAGDELGQRMLATLGSINLHHLRTAYLTAGERQQIVETAARISHLNISIDDSPARSISQIAAMARRTKRRQGLDLLVIDYLQLVQPENSRDPRQEQVAKISRRCKVLARELDIPIVVLAQVNRSAGDAARAPRLSELRESGAIEQDADLVLFVHRPAEYNLDLQPANPNECERAELVIAKNRNGPTGLVPFAWFRAFAAFRTLEERLENDGTPDPCPFDLEPDESTPGGEQSYLLPD